MPTTDSTYKHQSDDWWDDAGSDDPLGQGDWPETKKARKRRKKLQKLEDERLEWEQINNEYAAGNTPGPSYPVTAQPTCLQSTGSGVLNGIVGLIVVGGLLLILVYWIGLGSLIASQEESSVPWDSTTDGYSRLCQESDDC